MKYLFLKRSAYFGKLSRRIYDVTQTHVAVDRKIITQNYKLSFQITLYLNKLPTLRKSKLKNYAIKSCKFFFKVL